MSFSSLLAARDATVRDVLGQSITYTSGAGTVATVSGVFDAHYVRVDAGQAGVATVGPAVFLGLADLPSDPVADASVRVTVGGVVYAAHEVEPDGLGGVVMLLHRTT